MTLRLHNTLTKREEEFVPREAGRAAMYVCGPTVYDASHLGHMRAAVVFDVLRRYLEFRGFRVTHVQNITDVEDKIIARAQAEGVTTDQITGQYSAEYEQAARALNILPPHVEPRATRHVPEMVEMVRRLIERGHAYYAEGDVYFDVTTVSDYGKLSGRVLEELKARARVEPGEFKRHPADFALWKRAKPGEPSWDSPWGKGRPGWHIECSAMSLKYLGMGFDIHGGGDDLIFPHHENEIAQSEAYAGTQPFARYWVHNAMFQLSGEKMSKSERNFVSVADALRRYPPEVIRYVLVSVHYRKPIEYDPDRFEDARKAVDRIRSALVSVDAVLRLADGRSGRASGSETSPALGDAVARARSEFLAAMDDDLNTSRALAAVFELVVEVNRRADAVLKGTAAPETESGGLVEARDALRELVGILGLQITPSAGGEAVGRRVRELAGALRGEASHLFSGEPPQSLDDAVTFILSGREQARKLKDFSMADAIRTRLGEVGIIVEDLPTGPRWHIATPDGPAQD
ncbi:MAG TPA: cysteine--tRNA ligase [bacterium]